MSTNFSNFSSAAAIAAAAVLASRTPAARRAAIVASESLRAEADWDAARAVVDWRVVMATRCAFSTREALFAVVA